jgi:Fe-S-cluster-containing dehydrogenase component
MTTYCIMCKTQIPDVRAIRGSYTCTKACHNEYRKQRRAERSLRVCRFCGNRVKHKHPTTGSKPETINTGDLHSVQQGTEETALVNL